jgi:hypothetical protein
MAKKSAPPHFAPLQRVVAEPITDPAEQAAIDELRRRLRDENEAVVRHEVGAPLAKGAARVLHLCRQLPAKERLALLTQLTSQLSSDGQLELLERLLVRLPPKALKRLEEEIGPERIRAT